MAALLDNEDVVKDQGRAAILVVAGADSKRKQAVQFCNNSRCCIELRSIPL